MVFGISIQNIFKKNPKIVSVLKETEMLADKELRSLAAITLLLETYKELIDKAEKGEIREELKKNYAEAEKRKKLLSYLKSIRRLLNNMRRITKIMLNHNLNTLQNINELKRLIIEENNRLVNRIPLLKNKQLAKFLDMCQKMSKQKEAIGSLLGKALVNIQNMIKVAEKEMEREDVFNDKLFLQTIEMEKNLFVESIKEDASVLGISASSFEELTELEGLSQLIYDKEFFSEAGKLRRTLKWDKRIRAIAKIYIAFYAGFQIAVSSFLASYDVRGEVSRKTHFPAVHAQLQQSMENAYFRAADGYLISGTLIKNKQNLPTDRVMIFVHGQNFNATYLEPYIKFLRQNTEIVDFFSINLRSDGPDTPTEWYKVLKTVTLGLKESLDVVGAINYCPRQEYYTVSV